MNGGSEVEEREWMEGVRHIENKGTHEITERGEKREGTRVDEEKKRENMSGSLEPSHI